MADANIKFVRVRGKVVPIRADQVGKQKKRVQKTASDTVSRADAKKSLRNTVKKGQRREKILKAGAVFSSLSAIGLGLFARTRATPALRALAMRRFAPGVIAAATGGAFLGLAAESQHEYNKQLRKDSGRIGKAKALAAARVGNNYGARKAREYSSIFENRLKENQGLTPSAATINPMPPMQSAEIPAATSRDY